jgi:hypothetical protein
MIDHRWIGCAPGNFRPGRPLGLQPIAIVIHVMDGTLAGTDAWFRDPAAKVSAHYGVGVGGLIHEYVSEVDTAFHAGIVVNPTATLVLSRPRVNPNSYTIGIEHEGKANDAWTPQQSAASAALVADIASRRAIPLDVDHVFAHHEVRSSKSCPGSVQKAREILNLAIAHGLPNVSPPLQVRTIANVRVRLGAPSTMVPVLAIIPAGATVMPKGNVTGDSIQGNPNWYVTADGNYVWAGATTVPNPTY